MATMLDNAKIDELWIVDFPAPRYSPPIASKIASLTSSRIGIGLISPLIYDADYTLRWLKTLIDEHGERFDVLIGPGDRSALAKVGMEHWVPSKVVTHTLDVASRIKEEIVSSTTNCRVWLGAQGPRMIRESLDFDGCMLNLSDFAMIQWATRILESRDDSFAVGVFVPTEIVEKEKEVPSIAFRYTTAIIALGAPLALLKEFDIETPILAAREIYRVNEGMNAEVLQILGNDLLLRWGMYGIPDTLMGYLADMEKVGVNNIVFGPPISHQKTSIEMLSKLLKQRKEG